MGNITKLIVLFLLWFSSVTIFAQAEPERTLVFGMNTEGSMYYRIPALITAADGSLIAVADKRGTSLGDLPNTISVVVKRSTDMGKTWSSSVTIAEGNSGTGKTYGDPAIVLDKSSGKLLCIFAGDQGLWQSSKSNRIGIYISESTDNGLTWTAPRSITDQIYQSNWYGAFAGSGNALQLKDGRLMFVVAARQDATWGGRLYNYSCYSDDGGQTWSVSSNAAESDGDESKVVELENGDILMSIRNKNKGYRKFCISKDKGQTWGQSYVNTDILDPACNGDIIRYSFTKDGQSRLLHSVPGSSSIRENVTVYLSYDEGQNWKIKKLISDGYSAYSSMTVLPDGSIGILVEEGKWDSNLPGTDGFDLYFVRFTLDWLTGGSEPEPDPVPTGTLQLNGIDRYMSIPSTEDMNPETGGEYTVSCKIKIPQFVSGSNMRFISKRTFEGTDNNGATGYELFGGNSSDQSFSVNMSLAGKPWGNSHAWNSGLVAEQWAHLCWVFDGANKISRVYINGVAGDTKSVNEFATNSLANNFAVLVGAGYLLDNGVLSVPAYFAKGEMDDVRFYNKALSVSEVKADMTSVVNNETPNLVAAYDFENITGTTVPDISGNGHNGVLIGFPDITVRHMITIDYPDAAKGTLKVMEGDTQVQSGMTVAENTELNIVATPAEGYRVKQLLVNDEALESGVTTFTVKASTTVSVEFERTEEAGPEYCIPTGTITNTRYLTSITSVGAKNGTNEINYSVSSPLSSVYTKLANTLTVERKSTFTVNYVGNGNTSDGLLYAHAEIFVDWNGDGEFVETDEEWLPMIGEDAPASSAGWSNGDKMENISQQFTVPEDAVLGKSCIRIKYTDAWHNRGGSGFDPDHGPCASPGKGMVYDIPLEITESSTGISENKGNAVRVYPSLFERYFIIEGISVGTLIQVFDLAGECIYSKQAESSDVNEIEMNGYAKGGYLLRLTNNEFCQSYKLIKR